MALITFAGAELHYDVIDRRLPWVEDGDPIVFHHGVGSQSVVWSGWETALTDRHQLVRIDMRGHGRSPVPDGYSWGLDALVDDLDAVIDAAGLDRFHLVGESVGGTIALACAIRQGDRLKSLTICNGAHRGSTITNLAPWPDLIANGGTAAWSDHMMSMRFNDGVITDEQRQWYRDQQATADGAGVLALAATLAATDLTNELSAVTAPTLLIHPDSSPFIPVSLMAELKDALPDARLEVISNARHGLPFSHASQCATRLVTHIASTR